MQKAFFQDEQGNGRQFVIGVSLACRMMVDTFLHAQETLMRISLLLASLLAATLAQAAPPVFSFGAWGDMPYAKNQDATQTEAVIRSLNQSDIRFSLYDGDIKDGSSSCDDATFTRAAAMFNRLKKPLIYAVGDNEWTDCHRLNNGGYDPLERLARLRQVLANQPDSFGQTRLALTRQGPLGGKFAENVRFSYGGVVFIGLNVPGSNNNLVLSDKECTHKSARTLAQCQAGNAEYAERDAANIDWLRSGFAQAGQQHAAGVVVFFQADPGFDLPETEDVDESTLPQYKGYRALMQALTGLTEQYAGQVLLVHGDTHFFKVDKPLYSPTRVLPNLTRLETFGSPVNHWVRVTVDTRRPEVFTLTPVMVR